VTSFKEDLTGKMKAYFGDDARRIDHAERVTAYAEQLLEQEPGNREIVIGAAVLHDIGIPLSEKKYGSANGNYQEIEGPPVAREILTELGWRSEQIDEICEIIGHHHSPGKINTTNFKVLYDSDWLVNLADECDIKDRGKLTNIIDRVFLTETGKELARVIYLKT